MSWKHAARLISRGAGLLLVAVASVVAAAETDPPGATSDQPLSDTVWYDAELRKVVPVEVEPIVDDSLNRHSRWLPQAERVAAPNNPTGGAAGGGGNGLFGSGLTFGNLLGWMLLITIIGLAAGGLAYALSKAEMDSGRLGGSGGRARSALPDEQMIERMKHLPAELRRTDVNLRSEAQRLMDIGRYDQAIILLFGHQLLMLDQAGVLRLNRGKTNRKYLRETRAADVGAFQLLSGTVAAFERSYFGCHPIAAGDFERLWQANLRLEQLADRRRESAA